MGSWDFVCPDGWGVAFPPSEVVVFDAVCEPAGGLVLPSDVVVVSLFDESEFFGLDEGLPPPP